jgi:hypothetical protein
MDDPLTVRDIRNALRREQFRHANETELETGIAKVLDSLGLTVRRQVRLSDRDRIDIAVDLPRPAGAAVTAGIEVKIGGNAGAVRRQLMRYTECPELDALLLVTTVYRHMAEVMPYATSAGAPASETHAGAAWLLNGMPLELVLINRGML